MRSYIGLLIGASLLTLTLNGCGGSGGTSVITGTTPQSPPSTPPPPPPPPPSSGDLPVPTSAPDGPDHHPSGKGWILNWSDEFDGTELDRTKWEVEESCWGGGNNEHQCYTDRDRNVEVINGLLRLKAYPESYTGPEFPQGWPGGRGGQITQDYTSGKVRTRELASWTYGRFSARIKLAKGQGTWPAFWMLPAGTTYGSWAASGEIDIMESVNLGAACSDCDGDIGHNKTSGAIHYGGEWPNNTFTDGAWTLPGGEDRLDQYHVYAVEWGEGRINWFVDGVKQMTLNAEDWFTTAADKDMFPNAPFDQAFYLMFNLAVGGDYPENTNEGGLDPDSFPNEILIDWVRVYTCEFDGTTGRACMDGEAP